MRIETMHSRHEYVSLARCFQQYVSLILGPPGTDKTTTLTDVLVSATKWYSDDMNPLNSPFRCLCVSWTKTAVAVMAKAILDLTRGNQDWKFVMVGTAEKDFHPQYDYQHAALEFTTQSGRWEDVKRWEMIMSDKALVCISTIGEAPSLQHWTAVDVILAHFNFTWVDEAGQVLTAQSLHLPRFGVPRMCFLLTGDV